MAYSSSFGAGNVSFKSFCFKLFLRTMVAAFLTLIIYLSITTLVNGFSYKPLGYDVLYSKDGQNFEKVHTYMYTGDEGENWVDENSEKVCLPHTVQLTPAISSGCRNYQGKCIYRKNFNIPEEYKGKNVILEFEGAMGVSELFLNGKKIAEHFCGYTNI